MYTHTHTYINVPLYQSLIVYIRAAVLNAYIYIHKWSFILILILNYILCFKEMHCVNRIKCCGWIDKVTFLYHLGSLFSSNVALLPHDDDDDYRFIHQEIKFTDMLSVPSCIT